jgi:hypothetical protein
MNGIVPKVSIAGLGDRFVYAINHEMQLASQIFLINSFVLSIVINPYVRKESEVECHISFNFGMEYDFSDFSRVHARILKNLTILSNGYDKTKNMEAAEYIESFMTLRFHTVNAGTMVRQFTVRIGR